MYSNKILKVFNITTIYIFLEDLRPPAQKSPKPQFFIFVQYCNLLKTINFDAKPAGQSVVSPIDDRRLCKHYFCAHCICLRNSVKVNSNLIISILWICLGHFCANRLIVVHKETVTRAHALNLSCVEKGEEKCACPHRIIIIIYIRTNLKEAIAKPHRYRTLSQVIHVKDLLVVMLRTKFTCGVAIQPYFPYSIENLLRLVGRTSCESARVGPPPCLFLP